MTSYFSKLGIEQLNQQISKQSKILIDVGQQVGDEAGISCDWHDNFGFEEARRRLDMEANRLKSLNKMRESAQLLEWADKDDGIVRIGSEVTFVLGEGRRCLMIGAYGETLPELNLIAYESPLGRMMLGMCEGDSQEVKFQGQDTTIEIVRVDHSELEYLARIDQLYARQ
jgi:transcription elongation GreA/GreB family factor